MRFLRTPALHFVLIGTLLFAGAGWIAPDPLTAARALDAVIEVDTEKLDELRRDWVTRTGRAPDVKTLDALVDMAVDEEVLFREARAMNMHLLDPIVRRRLVQNMRFVNEADPRDDDELFDEAMALGMDRSDIVVRRRLVQIMQLRAQSLARLVEPAREELAEYLALHEERYIHPARVRVTHVYLSRDRRGDALERDATALRDRLNAESIRPDGAATHGDPFLYPADLPPRSEREFTKTFGPMFAAEVIELVPEPPDWRGPFESAYGMHVVWVHERTEARLPALEEVERELREAVFEEKGREELRRTTEELRRSYTVQRAAEPGEQAG